MKELFCTIETIALRISGAIKDDDTGYSESSNSSGDIQLELDVKCDQIVSEELSRLPAIKAIASEEREHQEMICEDGELCIAYDPLDGSSLIDVNLSVGTIFGIYEGEFQASKMVASAYIVYGPRIEIVTAYSGVVRHFVYREGVFKEQSNIALNQKGKLNAPGGTQQFWSKRHKELIDSLFGEGYRLRYSGGMVPDLHQILLKGGGVFSYPGAADRPAGKLRKLFEVFPFAFIYEMAGGEAIDETLSRLLELDCSDPHECSPCFFGSKYEIERVRKAYGQAE